MLADKYGLRVAPVEDVVLQAVPTTGTHRAVPTTRRYPRTEEDSDEIYPRYDQDYGL